MQLVRHGFTQIDAVDPSKDMLALLEKKQIYKNVICDLVGTNRLPIEDGELIGCTRDMDTWGTFPYTGVLSVKATVQGPVV